MKIKHTLHKFHQSTKPSWWKWLLIILLVVAMPLFFSLVRNIQIQQALIASEPEPQTTQQLKDQSKRVK